MTPAERLETILRGGYCTRWHANPDLAHIRETLAEHHGRVVQILLAIHPDPSLDLIRAAAHHDCGEPFVGDLPAPFKEAHPEIAGAHAEVEAEALRELCVAPLLTRADAAWLQLADRLAAFAHVRQVAPQLLDKGEWGEARQWLEHRSWELGCQAVIYDFVGGPR
ncbi:YfbR-like 5'-deoxynucleotidase [Frigidibacter sp. MR17.24]|uniref:YfbR-like 5'-deoxynucleotidase n=1 Tax=Frigidibacter sp. MR17.24 TaxID=3127345 RepID=UPI003012F947